MISIACILSCSDEKKQSPVTALDTGREFIRLSLDGDLPGAEKLILKDTENLQSFDSYKVYYERLPQEEKKHFRAAKYDINKYEPINDSTTIINYSNDYMKKPMEIKVVKVNKEWKIDFKYTYSGN